MRLLPCVLALNLITLSCMNQPTHYTYADGSGNRYILSPTSLEYDPITPEESSTGMYSGGDPKTINISAEQFSAAQTVLESAINNTAIHIPDRIKSSGAISVSDRNEMKGYVIQPGCAEKIAIEKTLNEILGQ